MPWGRAAWAQASPAGMGIGRCGGEILEEVAGVDAVY